MARTKMNYSEKLIKAKAKRLKGNVKPKLLSKPGISKKISGTTTRRPVPRPMPAVRSAGRPKNFSDIMKPIKKYGDKVLEVECGSNKAHLYLSKLRQGSNGTCIEYKGSWITPNEFQFLSGRGCAKDWKRSIRHHENSLKELVERGAILVHPNRCGCEPCAGITLKKTQAVQKAVKPMSKKEIKDRTGRNTSRTRTGNVPNSPTEEGTNSPTEEGTNSPTEEGTNSPTEEGTNSPTEEDTNSPTEEDTNSPTEEDTNSPTEEDTNSPTEEDTNSPTEEDTNSPTEDDTMCKGAQQYGVQEDDTIDNNHGDVNDDEIGNNVLDVNTDYTIKSGFIKTNADYHSNVNNETSDQEVGGFHGNTNNNNVDNQTENAEMDTDNNKNDSVENDDYIINDDMLAEDRKLDREVEEYVRTDANSTYENNELADSSRVYEERENTVSRGEGCAENKMYEENNTCDDISSTIVSKDDTMNEQRVTDGNSDEKFDVVLNVEVVIADCDMMDESYTDDLKHYDMMDESDTDDLKHCDNHHHGDKLDSDNEFANELITGGVISVTNSSSNHIDGVKMVSEQTDINDNGGVDCVNMRTGEYADVSHSDLSNTVECNTTSGKSLNNSLESNSASDETSNSVEQGKFNPTSSNALNSPECDPISSETGSKKTLSSIEPNTASNETLKSLGYIAISNKSLTSVEHNNTSSESLSNLECDNRARDSLTSVESIVTSSETMSNMECNDAVSEALTSCRSNVTDSEPGARVERMVVPNESQTISVEGMTTSSVTPGIEGHTDRTESNTDINNMCGNNLLESKTNILKNDSENVSESCAVEENLENEINDDYCNFKVSPVSGNTLAYNTLHENVDVNKHTGLDSTKTDDKSGDKLDNCVENKSNDKLDIVQLMRTARSNKLTSYVEGGESESVHDGDSNQPCVKIDDTTAMCVETEAIKALDDGKCLNAASVGTAEASTTLIPDIAAERQGKAQSLVNDGHETDEIGNRDDKPDGKTFDIHDEKIPMLDNMSTKPASERRHAKPSKPTRGLNSIINQLLSRTSQASLNTVACATGSGGGSQNLLEDDDPSIRCLDVRDSSSGVLPFSSERYMGRMDRQTDSAWFNEAPFENTPKTESTPVKCDPIHCDSAALESNTSGTNILKQGHVDGSHNGPNPEKLSSCVGQKVELRSSQLDRIVNPDDGCVPETNMLKINLSSSRSTSDTQVTMPQAELNIQASKQLYFDKLKKMAQANLASLDAQSQIQKSRAHLASDIARAVMRKQSRDTSVGHREHFLQHQDYLSKERPRIPPYKAAHGRNSRPSVAAVKPLMKESQPSPSTQKTPSNQQPFPSNHGSSLPHDTAQSLPFMPPSLANFQEELKASGLDPAKYSDYFRMLTASSMQYSYIMAALMQERLENQRKQQSSPATQQHAFIAAQVVAQEKILNSVHAPHKDGERAVSDALSRTATTPALLPVPFMHPFVLQSSGGLPTSSTPAPSVATKSQSALIHGRPMPETTATRFTNTQHARFTNTQHAQQGSMKGFSRNQHGQKRKSLYQNQDHALDLSVKKSRLQAHGSKATATDITLGAQHCPPSHPGHVALPAPSTPLDLTASKSKSLTNTPCADAKKIPVNNPLKVCSCGRAISIGEWTTDDVCALLCRLEGCLKYSKRFREHGVDGRILPMLTVDQLTHSLGMKLGPAVLLTQTVGRFLQTSNPRCAKCSSHTSSPSGVNVSAFRGHGRRTMPA